MDSLNSRRALTEDEITAALRELPNWTRTSDQISAKFEFADFREAVSFIVRIGFEAEDMNHHPELHNVYNRVAVSLTTHDAGNKLTELDFRLARAIQQVADGHA